MDRTLRDQWVAALRSGTYTQGSNRLCTVTPEGKQQFCCLGVLCDITNVPYRENSRDVGVVRYYDFAGDAPSAATLYGTLGDEVGSAEMATLVSMNDGDNEVGVQPKSFAEIADYIEKTL